MIKEAYVSYEVAKLLKEKGFNWITQYVYTLDGTGSTPHKIGNWRATSNIQKPTHQMACAWLREKYNICITIYPDKENGYEAVLYDTENDVEIVLQSFGIYGIHIYEEIYEDAVETAIKYCLENLI